MDLIVSVDENWAIGNKGDLLFRVSDDLKNFKRLTTGKTILYGDKTMATFPKGKPLPNRENIVLAADPDFSAEGAETVHSLEELLAVVREKEEVYVVGGASVYKLMLPYCKRAIITHFHSAKEADVFFPDLSKLPNWTMTEQGELRAEGDITYSICTWENSEPLK